MNTPALVADTKKPRSPGVERQGFWGSRVGRLCQNILGSAAARGINLLISLAQVPLTINALGREDYAFLAMAISLSLLSAYTDFGMGLAVVNTVAREAHKVDSQRSRRAVSVVWFTLLGIAVLGIIGMTGLSLLVGYFADAAAVTRYRAILLGVAFVFAGLPTGLIQRILFAHQRSSEANFWATSGRLLSLAVVWVLVESDRASLGNLVFAVIGVPVLVGWLSVLIVFAGASARSLRPKSSFYDNRLLKPYLVLGSSFLVMQLVPYMEVGIDTLLAGTLIDVQVVPTLDVYTRLFNYVPALMSIALFPLWPAIVSAKAQGDLIWIAKIRRQSYLLVGVLALIVSIILVFYGDLIVTHWTRKSLFVNAEIRLGMGVFAVLTCLGMAQSMVMNGLGLISQQAALCFFYSLVILFTKSTAALVFGWAGMIWSLNLCCVLKLIAAELMARSTREYRVLQ